MKKIIYSFLTFLFVHFSVCAQEITNDTTVYYSEFMNAWSIENMAGDSLVLTKKLIEGTGSYSLYNYSDGSLAFALTTDCEFIKDDKLIIIDNNLLKYYKLVFNGNGFEQIELSLEEIEKIFPDTSILKISEIDPDNKMWIHKPLFKNKKILLVNDTDRYFHKISCKSKNIQDSKIKGLITISRYGIFKFKHYGQRDGKLIFYIR